MIGADVTGGDAQWLTAVLAGLNVLQTIALAYLAARSHQDRHSGT